MNTEHKNGNTHGLSISTVGLEILVQDVMTRDVISIQKYEHIKNVATILAEKNISGLPVVDKENKVIGIISQADILSRMGMRRNPKLKDLFKHILGEHLPERKTGDIVGEIMVSPAITIKPGANIAEAAQVMDEKNIRRLPVVDDKNMLLGVISRTDILKVMFRQLK